MRKPVDESKLVQMYYIQKSWYSDKVNFSIVYGTVGAKTITVKRRDDIVGSTNDIRIDLDNSNRLFEDFGKAVEMFKTVSADAESRILEELEFVRSGVAKVVELINSIEDARGE